MHLHGEATYTEDVRCAYNALSFLTSTSQGVCVFIMRNIEKMIGPLFRAFHSELSLKNRASPYHICALLNHFLTTYPDGVVSKHIEYNFNR